MSGAFSGLDMQSGRARRLTVAVAVLTAILAGGVGVTTGIGTVGGVGDAPGNAIAADGVFAQEDVDADRVSLTAEIDESGDATWTIQYRVRLDTDEREEAFGDLERDVEENPDAYRDRFRQRMELTVGTAENATGRDMAVQNVRVRTERRELPESYGVLVYEFDWSNFAVVEDERIVAGDAIAGYFLEEGHRLTVTWPDGYELQSVSPSPDSKEETSVSWSGPDGFGSDDPRIVATTSSGAPVTGLGVAGVVAFAVIAAVLYWWRDRVTVLLGGTAGLSDTTERTNSGDRPGSGAAATETTTNDAASDSTATAGTRPGAGADSGESASEAGDSSEPSEPSESDEPPVELLSNEERVLKLVRENGGRMKQQDVVQELGWTEARTSQIVTGLREDGDLESFRLGRENVLRLPGADDEELP